MGSIVKEFPMFPGGAREKKREREKETKKPVREKARTTEIDI